MKFQFQQIAINPPDPIAARKLLADMGATEWAEDHVTAVGEVFDLPTVNEADLAFNYELFEPAKGEFEILTYTKGESWINTDGGRAGSVTHLGAHCTAEELKRWRAFFAQRNIGIAQQVFTQSHNNPAIAGKRWYNYVIFDTKAILGVDLKFIVRLAEKGVMSRE